jgi:hypothetical protein
MFMKHGYLIAQCLVVLSLLNGELFYFDPAPAHCRGGIGLTIMQFSFPGKAGVGGARFRLLHINNAAMRGLAAVGSKHNSP